MSTDSAVTFDVFLTFYDVYLTGGVGSFTAASLLSLIGVVALLIFKFPKPRMFHKTHLLPYILSLLLADIFQGIGNLINFRWIADSGILQSRTSLCYAQGALKQFGNLSSAFWALMLSIHLFHLVFLRRKASNGWTVWAALISGWGMIVFFVILGPTVLQKPEKGDFWSINGGEGATCWISLNYPLEQIFLEYFLEFICAGVSLILYAFILLRVRGNLYKDTEGWHLKWVGEEHSWKLAFERDLLDSSMYRVATLMLWFPITSALLLIPSSITKMVEIGGVTVPWPWTVLVSTLYNLGGFLNAIQLWRIQRHFPDLSTLPTFDTRRKQLRLSAMLNDKESFISGPAPTITPFMLVPSPNTETFSDIREKELQAQADRASIGSSVDMTRPQMPIPAHSVHSKRIQHSSGYGSDSSSDSRLSYGSYGTQSSVPTLPQVNRYSSSGWSSIDIHGTADNRSIHSVMTSDKGARASLGGPRRWI